jgi:alkylation response protein AidB-like acyl-CoA dehydrogenase
VGLAFDEVRVPESARLGAEGDGLKIAFAALDGGRIGIAAQAIGVSRAALEAAVRYARERQQFEAPLSSFQAIQFMLADSATALEAAWLLVMKAAWKKAHGLPFGRDAAQAKLFASERAFEVCDRALQVHGGYGFTRELPVERHLRDVRVTTIYEGTSQIQRIVIARHVLKEAAGHPA